MGCLITSQINEERLLALLILVDQYEKSNEEDRETFYRFYIQHLRHINNWNLVDASAHRLLGAHLWNKDRHVLIELAASNNLWHKRIAIVATWFFIKRGDFEWTVKISFLLLHDTHDLIHKAVGWMLREVGKQDQSVLMAFLDQYADMMPRTMLRYAIERLEPKQRLTYMMMGKVSATFSATSVIAAKPCVFDSESATNKKDDRSPYRQ